MFHPPRDIGSKAKYGVRVLKEYYTLSLAAILTSMIVATRKLTFWEGLRGYELEIKDL